MTKRISGLFIVFLFIFGFSFIQSANAQALTPSARATLIQQITAQLVVLEAQLSALQANPSADVTSTTSTNTTTNTTAIINIGDRVEINTDHINVRSSASITGPTLGQQNSGEQGTVTDGPVTANGYTWWNINWDTAPSGWTAGTYITDITTTATTNPTTPTTPNLNTSGTVPTITYFMATPSSVNSGQPSTLIWTTSTNATGCTLSGGTLSSMSVNPTYSFTIVPSQTTTYTLICSNGSTVSLPSTAVVTVNGTTPTAPSTGGPTVTFTANPTMISAGQSSTLVWTTSADALGCSLSGGPLPSEISNATHSVTVTPTQTATYSISCTNSSGLSTSASATVTVNSATPVTPSTSSPTVSSVSPTSSYVGGTVVVYGSNFDQNTFIRFDNGVTIQPYSIAAYAPYITFVVPSSLSVGSHTLAVGDTTNPSSVSSPVSLSIMAVPTNLAPTITSFVATPSSVSVGNPVTLSWTSSANTAVCSLGAPLNLVNLGALSSQIVIPTQTTTYSLTCATANGVTVTANPVTVTVTNGSTTGGPTVTLSANTTSVTLGQSAILTYSATTGSSCSANWPSGGNPVTVSPSQSTTYTLTCSNTGGTTSKSVTINVTNAVTLPVVTITSDVTTGVAGVVNPTLTWSVTNNPTSCIASGDWSGTKTSSGSGAIGILYTWPKIYTFTLTCSNAGGQGVPQSAYVTVTAVPSIDVSSVVTFTANGSSGSTTVAPGTQVDLSWNATNSQGCYGSASWTNVANQTSIGGSGNIYVSPTQTTTYTISCLNVANSSATNASVTVNVTSTPSTTSSSTGSAPSSVSLSASPTTITTGNPATLAVTSTNATSCNISGGSSPINAGPNSSVTVNPSQTTTYSLTCSNSFGSSAPSNATVVVNSAASATSQTPTVTLVVNQTSVAAGQAVVLNWSSTNATSCASLDGYTTGTSGSVIVYPSQTTTYTETCNNSVGVSASASVTITASQASSGGSGGSGSPVSLLPLDRVTQVADILQGFQNLLNAWSAYLKGQ